MLRRLFLSIIFLLSPLTANALSGANACQGSEYWNYDGKTISKKWQEEFHQFLIGKRSAAWGFSQALALRRISETPEAKIFAEYWISRALYAANLVHIAHRGFNQVTGQMPSAATVGIQTAALDCLTQIHERYSTLVLSSDTINQLPNYLAADAKNQFKKSIWESSIEALMNQIAEDRPSREIQATLTTLKDSGAYLKLGKALFAAHRGDHPSVVANLKPLIEENQLPSLYSKLVDSLRVIYSRSLFSTKQYDQAANQLQLVKKTSNELAHTLSELGWAYLLSRNYKASIGTAVQVQSGAMRTTFAPEAPMVMSIAFNELCHYPKALQGVEVFRKNYVNEYAWLSAWKNDPELSKISLYNEAIKYLKRLPVKIPERVIGEWVRSPSFLARQDEINLIVDEKKDIDKLGTLGDTEQSQFATQLLGQTRDTKKKYLSEKSRLKPGQTLSQEVQSELEELREQVAIYRRFRSAAPVWRTILQNYQASTAPNIANLTRSINADFRSMNQRMFTQLKEVAENNYFIEVEIFNGASRDMIWKNAFPDYEKVAADLDQDTHRTPASEVYNWGNIAMKFDGKEEVWEDELGAFKADIYDNCENKNRYLTLRKEQVARHIQRIQLNGQVSQ